MDATFTAAAALTVSRPRRTRRSSSEVKAEKALIARIREALETNPVAVVRALEALYDRQTRDEQAARTTAHSNSVGFSGCDADTGSWLVQVVIAEGREKGRSDRDLLRGKALEIGRRITKKYASTQLLALAREKEARDATEALKAARRYTPPSPASFGFAPEPVETADEVEETIDEVFEGRFAEAEAVWEAEQDARFDFDGTEF